MQKLLLALDIRPAETRPFFLMLLLSFLIGGGTVFADTGGNALFLAEFGAAGLPIAFVASAVTMILIGGIYSRLQSRISLRRLMSVTLFILALVMALLRIGLALSGNKGFIFAALLVYRNIYIFGDMVFWLTASVLFTIRQGKRLFSLMSTGSVIARILGYLLTPLIVSWIGSINLLYVSSALLALGWLLVYIITRGNGEVVRAVDIPPSAKRATNSRYVYLLYASYGLGSIAFYLISFNFYAASGIRYPDADQLASFFGIFTGAAAFAVLIAKSFFAGPLLNRRGLLPSMMIRPVMALALAAVMLVVTMTSPIAGSTLFALAIVQRFSDTLLYNGLYRPGFALLYQPLHQPTRGQVQATNEAVVGAIALGLVGAILMLVGIENIVLNSALLTAAAVMWLVSLLALRSEYVKALTNALRHRWLSGGELDLRDPATRSVLGQKLASSHANEVIYALELMARDDPMRVVRAVPELLGHADPLVRRDAVLRAESLQMSSVTPVLQQMLLNDSDLPTRAAAVRTLGSLSGNKGKSMIDALLPYVEVDEPEIREAALIGLLRSDDKIGRKLATQRVEALASGAPENRQAAASILTTVESPALQKLLSPLLNDPDPAVRRIAFKSAHLMPDAEALLFDALSDRSLGPQVSRTLARFGNPLLPQLGQRFAATSNTAERLALIAVAGQIDSDSARTWLAARLTHADGQVRERVVRALYRQQYSVSEADSLLPLIALEVEAAKEVQLAAQSCTSASTVHLRSSLQQLLNAIRERTLLILSFGFDRALMGRIRDNLRLDSAEKQALALELLDVELPTSFKRSIIPMMQAQDSDADTTHSTPESKTLASVMVGNSDLFTPWVRACAIHASGLLELAELLPEINRCVEDGDWLVAETAGWALDLLSDDSSHNTKKRPDLMLLTIEKVLILRTVDIFATTPDDTLVQVAELLDEVTLEAGDTIFEKGDLGDSMYIIVNGKVRAHDGEQIFNYLGERSVFGEMALLDPEPRVASITAEEPTLLLKLDEEPLGELMETRPEVARGIIRVLSRHLRARIADINTLRASRP